MRSSLTLLIPSSGAVKVGSTIGKALNVGGKTASFTRKITGASKAINNGKKLNKFQRFMNSEGTANATKLFLENGTTAVLSRAIENYQEARQTYNDMYTQAYDSFKQMSDEEYQQIIDGNAEMLKEQGVDPNNKNEVAKAIAKQSADVTFRTDWLNVGWDVIQMYALRNAWKGLRNAPENSAAVRRAQKDAIKYAGQYNSEAELAALKAKRKFREKAKEWVDVITSMYGGNYNIEQYELDAPIPERKEYLFFEAYIEDDVIIKPNFDFYFADEPTDIKFFRQINGSYDKACIGTIKLRQGESIESAKERAVKVVQDEFYKWMMMNKL